MAWRVAKSLLRLREQIDGAWPDRSRASDGTIGDAAHRNRPSDHNPNAQGVVTAMDITHDPANGADMHKLAAALVGSRDPRIKYLIWNRQILTPRIGWHWRPYTGTNPHTRHLHISVMAHPGLYDSRDPWSLPGIQRKDYVEDEVMRRGHPDTNAVVRLQQRLNQEAVVNPKLKVDGDFGGQTERAVKQVQAWLRYRQTGIYDLALNARLLQLEMARRDDDAKKAVLEAAQALIAALPKGGSGISKAEAQQVANAAIKDLQARLAKAVQAA